MFRPVLLAMLLVLVAAASASAATYSVSNTNDVAAADPASGCATPGASAAGGACTLRSAVQAANAAGGANTINLAAGTYKLTIAPSGSDDDSTGDLNITETTGAVTITGAGASNTTVDANYLDRAFNVGTGGAILALSGVTVTHGRPGGYGPDTTNECPQRPQSRIDGGAILSNGTLELTDDVITDNITPGFGGGVADDSGGDNVQIAGTTISDNLTCAFGNGQGGQDGGGLFSNTSGTLGIDRSRITGNGTVSNAAPNPVTGGAGGGIAFEPSGNATLNLTSTTISDNQGLDGGGLFVTPGGGSATAHLVADTVSGNHAPPLPNYESFNGFGGGLLIQFSSASIVNTTITGNDAGGGGGIMGISAQTSISFSTIDSNTATNTSSDTAANLEGVTADPFTLDDTIVSGGIAPSGVNTNCSSGDSFTSAGHNVFDDTADAGAQCGASSSGGDLIADPKLASLADNGGPTLTQALLPGSPAINAAAANAVCVAETNSGDQRELTRPQGPLCDIGAFEAQTDLALASSVSPSSAQVGGRLTFTDTITNNGPAPATNVTFSDPGTAGFTITSASSSQGGCTHTGTTVSCSVGTVPVGGRVVVTVVVTGTSPGTATLKSSVTAGESDTNPANNTAMATGTFTSTAGADMAISKTASPKRVSLGRGVAWTVKVANHGPNTDTGVTVTDKIPSGLKLGRVTTSLGRCSGHPTVICRLGTMKRGARATVTIRTTSAKLKTITNSATVKGQLHDPNTKNNTAKASVRVLAAPCRQNLYFVSHWDPTARVGTVRIYLDGRRTHTLHGSNIRKVKVSAPPAKGQHSVTVMFVIDPWHTVSVTRSYNGCATGATSYAYPPATSPGAS